MTTFVVDACALIAYLFDEEGSNLFESMQTHLLSLKQFC